MGRIDVFFRGDVGNFSVLGSRRQKTRPGRGGMGSNISCLYAVQNSRISIAEQLDVVGESQLLAESGYMGNFILMKT